MSERFKTVREAFIRIDTDGDGTIAPPELRAQLELMGMRLSGREFRRLWRLFDTSGDDQLNYVEFNNKVGKFIKPASMGLQMNRPETPPMKDWQQKNVAAQIRKRVTDIDATFNEIDQDGSGVIDQTELMIALRKLGLRGIGDQECFSVRPRPRTRRQLATRSVAASLQRRSVASRRAPALPLKRPHARTHACTHARMHACSHVRTRTNAPSPNPASSPCR
jgi:Ca2+-binding EF-hand superfamily protein